MGSIYGIERVVPLVFIMAILAASSIPEIAGQITISSNSFAPGKLHFLWLSKFLFFFFSI
jgi:hypothetical protein